MFEAVVDIPPWRKPSTTMLRSTCSTARPPSNKKKTPTFPKNGHNAISAIAHRPCQGTPHAVSVLLECSSRSALWDYRHKRTDEEGRAHAHMDGLVTAHMHACMRSGPDRSAELVHASVWFLLDPVGLQDRTRPVLGVLWLAMNVCVSVTCPPPRGC